MMKMLQEKIKLLREELAQVEVIGEAAGGLVKVTANGQREIIAVEISPEALTPENASMLQDLLLAAIGDAQRKATQAAMEKLGPLTGGMPLPPGLFS